MKITNNIIQPYNFEEAESLSIDERISQSLDLVRTAIRELGVQQFFPLPMFPSYGATETEILALETINEVRFPEEYRQFLRTCRYLIIDDGLQIWGEDYEGVIIGRPWLSEKHAKGRKFLIFGDYWEYADGDQLMFDMDDPLQPVIVYLHEHGPLYEYFAPSFSFALWRISHEMRCRDT